MDHSTPPTPRIPLHRTVKISVWAMTYGLCWYCGEDLNPFLDFCIDHVVPLSRGGGNHLSNLVPSCSKCNSSKGSLLIEEWRSPFCDRWGVLNFWFERGVHLRAVERPVKEAMTPTAWRDLVLTTYSRFYEETTTNQS